MSNLGGLLGHGTGTAQKQFWAAQNQGSELGRLQITERSLGRVRITPPGWGVLESLATKRPSQDQGRLHSHFHNTFVKLSGWATGGEE